MAKQTIMANVTVTSSHRDRSNRQANTGHIKDMGEDDYSYLSL